MSAASSNFPACRWPTTGRAKSAALDPLSIPAELQTALEALYGHYVKIYDELRDAGIEVPPCFIVVERSRQEATYEPKGRTTSRREDYHGW